MCSIIGALIFDISTRERVERVNALMSAMIQYAGIRGRDGIGWTRTHRNEMTTSKFRKGETPVYRPLSTTHLTSCIRFVGNARAEPTTEWVKQKSLDDQQPYTSERWTVAHNGTIANDKELRSLRPDHLQKVHTSIDSAAIPELLATESISGIDGKEDLAGAFLRSVRRLKGSYGIVASHEHAYDSLYIAVNYRPVWLLETKEGYFFASSRKAFGNVQGEPRMLKPYSVYHFQFNWFTKVMTENRISTMSAAPNKKTLVVCSGGLDSVVTAQHCKSVLKMDVELMHFQYGSKAQTPELEAVKKIAEYMQVPLHIRTIPAYDVTDSNLLNPESKIAGGEEGAEFAHEWVPARNLLLLATATAFAEAKGFSFIALGNNMEEAGAYPDNEPEFIDRFSDILRFAVGAGKFLEIIQPVGNMMKHEIVKLGHDIGAPLHLTWSCYKAGQLHCGTCGPCFMRRTAFQINNLEEVITYES